MGYLHINNLYRDQDILLFREAFAMEKIHGTSSHISWNDTDGLKFFSGGATYETFVSIFNKDSLASKFKELAIGKPIIVYGEAYGGKMQRMSHTYGSDLRFVAFDVKIGDTWLDVPGAERFVLGLNLEFVHYERIPTDIKLIDHERDADSVQAMRNGMGSGHMREGIVLRPIIELTKSNGQRIIVKHKRAEFCETKTPREVDPSKQDILKNANLIAEEWVTQQRLSHVLDHMGNPPIGDMSIIPSLIKAMIEDVIREASSEIIDSKEARRAIGAKAVELYKNRMKDNLS